MRLVQRSEEIDGNVGQCSNWDIEDSIPTNQSRNFIGQSPFVVGTESFVPDDSITH